MYRKFSVLNICKGKSDTENKGEEISQKVPRFQKLKLL